MPLLWLGLSFVLGIFLASRNPQLSNLWIFVLFASLLFSFLEFKFIPSEKHVLRSKQIFKTSFGLFFIFLSLGAWRYQAAEPTISDKDLAFYHFADDIQTTGVIVSYPQISADSSTAIVRAEEIYLNGETITVEGKLELRLPPGFNLSYGDRVLLSGDLSPAVSEDTPVFASYLARRFIYSRMYYPHIEWLSSGQGDILMSSIYRIRTSAWGLITKYLPAREASLLSGILLGVDWTIPRYLEDAYRATGTVHIIAISGFNITLIAWQIIHLFRKLFYPVTASILAILAIIFYTVLVGADPAVVRAAVMGSLAIPAYFIGRRSIGIHSLTIAAAVMLMINPLLLWDVGFQLSFLATMGLMVLANPTINFISSKVSSKWGEDKAGRIQPLLILVIPTLAAQFAVSPVLFNLDGAIQLYSLPANMLILPLQPLLMTISGLGVLVGLLVPAIGGLLLMLARPMAAFCNQAAMRFAYLPGAVFPAPVWSGVISLIAVTVVLVSASIAQIRNIGRPKTERD